MAKIKDNLPTEIEFKCPRCGNQAFYYVGLRRGGCLLHGWLLYTEIPESVKNEAHSKKEIENK